MNEEKLKKLVVKMARCKNWDDIPSGLCFSKKQIEKLIKVAAEYEDELIVKEHPDGSKEWIWK